MSLKNLRMKLQYCTFHEKIIRSPKTFYYLFSGMNNRECIDQVERGYRMAQPSHISYPESKTHAKELAVAQANVYKVSFETYKIPILRFL